MRQLIYSALQSDDMLQDILPADPGEAGAVRVYQMGSLGVGQNPAKPKFPFLLVGEGPLRVNHVDRSEKSTTRTFVVYCYDQHGFGYEQIEQVLFRVRDTLLALITQVSPDGVRCTDVKWLGWSVDSRDPEYVANMKSASFQFVSNR